MSNFPGIFSLRVSLFTLLLILSGCTALPVSFEAPDVKLVSVKLLPSDSMEQRLAIGLRISNPNAVTLYLAGMRYSLRMQGYDLASGVSNNIPDVGGYADASMDVIATVDWLNGLQLLKSLLDEPGSQVSYELEAKLDPGAFLPPFYITERGMINLGQEE